MSSNTITRNDLKNILNKTLSSSVIHRVDAPVASSTIAANARGHFRISNVIPSGAIVLGIIVNITPNNDWFNTMAYMDGTDVIIRYHNEYSNSLTGTFNAVVSYVEIKANNIEADIGTVYSAAWTATSTNANLARVTEDVTLPKGTYIGFLKIPVVSQTSALGFGIQPLGFECSSMFSSGQSVASFIVTINSSQTVYGVTNMSQATTYTYTERGYLNFIKIA